MVNSNLKNVAVERTRDDEGRREAAYAVSRGAGGGTVESLVIKGAQRRMTKAEGPDCKAAAARGRNVMGRGSNDIGEQIGRELRGLFDEVLAQPVPDRFLDLLNRLETNTISSKAKAKAPGDM